VEHRRTNPGRLPKLRTRRKTMGLFEEYPWLLIPIIIITVEAWNVVKGFAKQALHQRTLGREVERVDG
jgi:hypothetical protein